MPKQHIVLIHGLMGSLDFFSPAALLPDFIIHTPALIGYGDQQAMLPQSLEQQAEFVLDSINTQVKEPCWILGHSVGGAIAVLVAQRSPSRVRGLISVEGNFTLNDAFWCAHIAQLSSDAWRKEYQTMQADPAAWLAASVPVLTPTRLAWATAILQFQSAQTIQAQAQAVVAGTGPEHFLQSVQAVVDAGVPLYLLSGERSRAGWDIPNWVATAAKQHIVLPNTGHMMMLEEPRQFCEAIADCINVQPTAIEAVER